MFTLIDLESLIKCIKLKKTIKNLKNNICGIDIELSKLPARRFDIDGFDAIDRLF